MSVVRHDGKYISDCGSLSNNFKDTNHYRLFRILLSEQYGAAQGYILIPSSMLPKDWYSKVCQEHKQVENHCSREKGSCYRFSVSTLSN